MVEVRRILCPTDFSDISRHALEHAIVIAGWYGSQIVALHVGHPAIVLSTAVPIPVFTREIAPGDIHRQPLEEELRRAFEPGSHGAPRAGFVVQKGTNGCL